jgi:hypothetical protein
MHNKTLGPIVVGGACRDSLFESAMKQLSTLGLRNPIRISLFILLVAGFVLLAGCESTESTKNPLTGWKSVAPIGYKVGEMSATIDTLPGYKTISDDVQSFVNMLPVHRTYYDTGGYCERRYCYWIQRITLFEDGNGQHAVVIEIPVEGTYQNYVIIYNKSNERIKTTRFSSGHYAC